MFINPQYRERINEFIQFKSLVISSAEQNTDLVDIRLLKSYIEQIDMRIMIMQVNVMHGISSLPNGKTMDDLFIDSIKELSLLRPS